MGHHYPVRNARFAVLGLSGALAVGGLFGLARSADAATCPQNGTSVTCTFINSGGPETFVVPPGVTSALITLRGGAGGDGASLNAPSPGTLEGGAGGVTTATVALTPGAGLGIFVGGNGGNGQGCEDGDIGPGGFSGGVDTSGIGGSGVSDGIVPAACAGGGGGGGSFVMVNGESPAGIEFDTETGDPVDGSAIPLLAAGGGGGGGGGTASDVNNIGGDGGGNTTGIAEDGRGDSGGYGGNSDSASGGDGSPGSQYSGSDVLDGGGGGGGGFPGGIGGGTNAIGTGTTAPGSGGGGGEGFPRAVSDSVVPAASIPASIPASGPAQVVGPVYQGLSTAGAPGSITITYSAPAVPNTTDTAQCVPGHTCVATPPPGQESTFQVTASGGDNGATLFAILNGGLPPTCKSVSGQLSPDWVQFGFEDPKDGRTWSKKIRVTGSNPTTKSTAQTILAQTQICFAAPYKFVVKRGFKLSRPDGSKNWEGLLAHCQSDIIAEAKRDNPSLERPCVLNRSLLKKGDGWVVRVNYFVPNGQLDPQGRSVRKKKKHH